MLLRKPAVSNYSPVYIYICNPPTVARMWHKALFLEEDNCFSFTVIGRLTKSMKPNLLYVYSEQVHRTVNFFELVKTVDFCMV